jgi:hypothetical protein
MKGAGAMHILYRYVSQDGLPVLIIIVIDMDKEVL